MVREDEERSILTLCTNKENIDRKFIGRVEKYRYLRVDIISNTNQESEINIRKAMARQFPKNESILCAKSLCWK